MRILAILTLIGVLRAPFALAGTYSPPGLYDPILYTLENGLQVILKPRPTTRSVSVRLVVGLGTRHFPCDKEELPHLIEHLLFMGTSRHSETELDDRIESNGGDWNAATDLFTTTYEVDIFSGRAKVAVDTLYEMFTDAQFDEERLASAKGIAEIEAGGGITFASQVAERYGFFQAGAAKALQQLNVVCTSTADPGAVSLTEVAAAFAKYYTPANMTFIAVGDFDPDQFAVWIAETFGRLEPGTTPVPAAPPLTVLSSPEHVSSTLAPIIGSSVETSLFWPAPREDDADYWPLWVAADYLDRELYQTLRTERAESYSPTAMYVNYGEWALLQLYADGATGTEALLENGILEVLKKVSIGPIDANGFESVKMAILLGSASGFESNASFAGYYADRLPQLKGYGRYLDEESDIENVTPETMQAAVRRWLVPEKRLAAYEVPTMQQQTMVFLLIGVGAVLIVALGVSYRRLRVGRSS